jgi:DNA mismatch repair protein MutL
MEEGRIRVLGDDLVNLIAAGEIVERPASVVKELVENSLDALAKSIDVEIRVGGKQLIVVSDDGIGMSSQDAGRALLRHATSKIRDKGDLTSIHTLGFRGEALPSIASVSRFTLFSREHGADVGTEIRVEGGEVKYTRDAGVPPGSRIVVEDLFFSVPARRKFLKSEKTEYFNIFDVAAKHALARPDVRFRLVADGREVINALPGTLRYRVGDIVGKRIAQEMGELSFEAEGVRVTGLVGRPVDTRATQNAVHLFVNDRPVRDFSITSAIARAYAGLIFRDRFPIAIVFVQVGPAEVDVNIHPTKREVKFRDPRAVAGIVFHAVQEAARRLTEVSVSVPGQGATYPAEHDDDRSAVAIVREVGEFYFGPATASGPAARGSSPAGGSEALAASFESGSGVQTMGPSAKKILGQVAGTYIILADSEGLVCIDQHAAHERVIYEEIRAGYGKGSIPTQRLLFPIALELPVRDREVIDHYIEKIREIGIEIEGFGGETLLIRAIPAAVKDADVKDLVGGLIEEVREGGAPTGVEDVVDRMIKGIACHGSVRAGKELSTKEIETLITQMGHTPYAAHCPHGRPTMIRIGNEELAKRFKRS